MYMCVCVYIYIYNAPAKAYNKDLYESQQAMNHTSRSTTLNFCGLPSKPL